MRQVLVDYRFDTPQSDEDLRRMLSQLRVCQAVREIQLVRGWLSLDRLRLTVLLSAPDARSVRYAHVSAGVPFDVIWPAWELGADGALVSDPARPRAGR